MKQPTLPGTKAERTIKSVSEGYAAANLRSAGLILEDPEKWGGEEAGLVKWAREIEAKNTERGNL